MIIGNSIAPHEALELHELLTFKNVCATKSATMAELVKDDELKWLLNNDYNVAQAHISELQELVQKADWNVEPMRTSDRINI
jgi:similar to spore coat protein